MFIVTKTSPCPPVHRMKSLLIMLSFDFCNLLALPHVHRILDP